MATDETVNLAPENFKDKIRINTFLYLCQHYISDPDTFDEVVLSYLNFKVNDVEVARCDLRRHVVEKMGEDVVKDRFKGKFHKRKGYVKEIKELFEIVPPSGGKGFLYVAHPFESKEIIDSSSSERKLDRVRSDLDTVMATVTNLTKCSVAKPSNEISINVPTSNSYAAIAANGSVPNSLNVPNRQPMNLNSQRKRKISDRNGERSVSRDRRKEKQVGSAGNIKEGTVSSAPKYKRAVKVTCYKEISKTDLEQWCNSKSDVLKKYKDYKVEQLAMGKYNHSFRITCDNWPSDAGDFHSGSNWPTGIDVVQWTGPIRELSPDNALLLYIGRMDPESSEAGVESEIKKLYKDKSEIELAVVKLEKPDRFGDVSFAVKVTSKDASVTEKPEDLVTEHMRKLYAYVRSWTGFFPRKRNSVFKKAKLTVTPVTEAMNETS
jgi:hypothetical protein